MDNSTLFQERSLATLEEWTPSEVAKRRKAILAWAARRWQVPAGPAAPEADED